MSIKKKNWTGERLETYIHSETATEHLHRYAVALEYVKDKVVLDIASGEGYGSNLMAEKAQAVIGVDIDQQSIVNAIHKYKRTNLSFLEGTADAIPLQSGTID
ncbi:MAG: class I SAM-dependent methyltransferase, partial [Chryseobacterium sp.]